jgi:MFS transporter, ACS family, D-galactonate transporter
MSRRWILVALIFTGIVIAYIDRGNLGIAATSIMRDFNLAPPAMGTLLSAFFWTYATFQIPAGAIIDRFGIKRVYAVAFVGWCVASAAIALSRNMTDILLMLLLLGLAESVGPIASLAYIRRNFSGADLGLPTAIYIAGQNVGPALGALVGSMLIAGLGWRPLFAITGIGALVWLPFWLWLAPRDGSEEAKRTAAASAAVKDAPVTAASLRQALNTPAVWLLFVCIFLSSYYWYFLLTWVPSYLTLSRGLSTIGMGRVLSAAMLAMAAFNIVFGALADRMVRRAGSVFRVRVWFCAAGYALASVILLLLVMPGQAVVLPILVISVCAIGVGNSNYWAIAQHTPPARMVGRTIGVLNTIAQFAGAAAPLITGWILGPQKQFTIALLIAGLCPIAACLCLLMAGERGLERTRQTLAGASTAAAVEA